MKCAPLGRLHPIWDAERPTVHTPLRGSLVVLGVRIVLGCARDSMSDQGRPCRPSAGTPGIDIGCVRGIRWSPLLPGPDSQGGCRNAGCKTTCPPCPPCMEP